MALHQALHQPALPQTRSALAGETFPGHQEGERVLYVIRSHWIREAIYAVKVLFVAAGLVGVKFLAAKAFPLSEVAEIRVYLLVALGSMLAILWQHLYCRNSRTYLTDRRVMRFEGVIPFLQSKRSLLWADVSKARSLSPSLFLQVCKVGHLEILPNFDPDAQSVRVPFVYYHEDLAAYIDKIVYTVRSKPAEVDSIREFVTKPKGHRY